MGELNSSSVVRSHFLAYGLRHTTALHLGQESVQDINIHKQINVYSIHFIQSSLWGANVKSARR